MLALFKLKQPESINRSLFVSQAQSNRFVLVEYGPSGSRITGESSNYERYDN